MAGSKAAGFAILLLACRAITLAQPVPVGTELAINSYTTGDQMRPAIGMSGTGSFVVVWSSMDQDGSGYGIFGRRFDSSGVGLGTEFAVSLFTTGAQDYPPST